MTFRALGRYLSEYRRALFLAAMVGVSIVLLFGPLTLKQPTIAKLLALDELTLGGIWILQIAGLFFCWPAAVNYFARYRATLGLRKPPLVDADVFVTFTFSALVTWTILLSRYGPAYEPTSPVWGSLFFGSFAFWVGYALIRSKALAKAPDEQHQNSPVVRAISDEPITEDDEDLLGRVTFAEGLYKEIVSFPVSSPFTYGLYGVWGEGKTSVVNLLLKRLGKHHAVVPVLFNPWYYDSLQAITHGFYQAIEQALEVSFTIGGLHRALDKYQSLLISGARYVGLPFAPKPNPELIREELENWIQRSSRRLVVIIDDIDRLQPAEVLAVFKLVRLPTSIKNIIFVLTFDRNVIAKSLASIHVDSDYIEKIIQKPISVPPAEQRDINRFLLYSDLAAEYANRSAVDRLLDDLQVKASERQAFDKQIVQFYQTRLFGLFRTLRDAKRFMNSLAAKLPAVVKDVNLYDFFLLQCLEVFAPAVHEDIWTHPWFYLPTWTTALYLISPFDPLGDEQVRLKRIRDHVTPLLESSTEKELVSAILVELFGEVAKAMNNSAIFAGSESMAAVEKRLTHPACFPRYFISRIPAGELADSIVEKIIEDWNSGAGRIRLIGETLERYRSDGQLRPLFEKLKIFKGSLIPEATADVVRAISGLASSFSEVAVDDLGDTEQFRAVALLLQLLENCEPALARTSLEGVARETENVAFAAHLVLSWQRGPGKFQAGGHLATLREIITGRLQSLYIDGERDIFDEFPVQWQFLLYQWATDFGTFKRTENRGVVQRYLSRLFSKKPDYLGRVLYSFAQGPLSDGGFDMKRFSAAYDPKFFIDALERYGPTGVPLEEHRTAAERFIHTHKNPLDRDEPQYDGRRGLRKKLESHKASIRETNVTNEMNLNLLAVKRFLLDNPGVLQREGNREFFDEWLTDPFLEIANAAGQWGKEKFDKVRQDINKLDV